MVERIKFIKLTQKQYAIVDVKDFESVSKLKWALHKKGFVNHSYRNKIKKKTGSIAMHRFIIQPASGVILDHIDGDKTDNRRINLRICTSQQNTFNQKLRKTNKSGYKGVYWSKEANRWRAQIRFNKSIYLGTFQSKEDAAKAYDTAATKYHGEFARLNFPEDS